MKKILKLGVVAVAMAAASLVRANSIFNPPDIEANDLNIVVAPGSLTAVDSDSNYFDNSDSVILPSDPNEIIAYDTTYKLNAILGPSGNLLSGTIEIDSDEILEYSVVDGSLVKTYLDLYDLGESPIPIITGNLTSLESSGGAMHLNFDVTGGFASSGAGDLDWFGSTGQIWLNTVNNTSDVYVPAPEAALGGSALLGALGFLRRRRSAAI